MVVDEEVVSSILSSCVLLLSHKGKRVRVDAIEHELLLLLWLIVVDDVLTALFLRVVDLLIVEQERHVEVLGVGLQNADVCCLWVAGVARQQQGLATDT